MISMAQVQSLPSLRTLEGDDLEEELHRFAFETDINLGNQLESQTDKSRSGANYKLLLNRVDIDVVLEGANQYDDARRLKIMCLSLDGQPFALMALRDAIGEDDEDRVRLVNTDPVLAQDVISALQACVRTDYLDVGMEDSADSLLSFGGYSRVNLENGSIDFLDSRRLVEVLIKNNNVALYWFEEGGYRIVLDSKVQPAISRDDARDALMAAVEEVEKVVNSDIYPTIIYSDMDGVGHVVAKPGMVVEEAGKMATVTLELLDAEMVQSLPSLPGL